MTETEPRLHSLIKKVQIKGSQPIDPSSLCLFRIMFGILATFSALRFMWMGWIEDLYLTPTYFFTYEGFEWIHPHSQEGLYLHFSVLVVLGVLITLGVQYRLSITLYFLLFTWVELFDKTTYLNHYYLVSLLSFLMIFLPLDRAFVLRFSSVRIPFKETVPLWCLFLLRFQVAVVYIFAGLTKVNADWLIKGEPLATWLATRDTFPLIGGLFQFKSFAIGMSWAGMFYDLLIIPALLWSRSRPYAYLAVIFFHIFTWLLFPIGVFPWIMIAASTLFLPPSWPRLYLASFTRLLSLSRSIHPSTSSADSSCRTRGTSMKVISCVGIWCLFQMCIPLRFLAYEGEHFWTERGFRFAWKVMLIEKTGFVEYRVVRHKDGRVWKISPRQDLTPLQFKMMRTQPDMIRQYAFHLAHLWGGKDQVAIYADSFASLHGRPTQRLIDPKINLLIEPLPHTWIVPLDNK